MIRRIVACSVTTLFFAVQCDQIPVDQSTIMTIINNTDKLVDKCNCPDDTVADEDETPPPPPPVEEKPGILFAWYPFNGNADDATGNGHDGVVHGATLTDDRFGNPASAYLFDGTDDYIIAENFKDFPSGNVPRTMAGWFKSSNDNPYLMSLFGFGAMESEHNFMACIGPGTADNPGTQYRVNGWNDSYDWRTGIKTPAYLDGEWHHCAVTYDGTVTKIYFDGELKSSTSAFKYLTSPENMRMVIGFEIDLDEWDWNGALDDIYIYSRVLTDDEIRELGAPVTPPPPPPPPEDGDLYASYPFSGNADDATGNGHDGVVHGATLTDDRFGNPGSAYLFDGTDDYIIAENFKDFPGGNVPRTMAGWFKSSNDTPYLMSLFGFGAMESEHNFMACIGPGTADNPGTQYRVNGWNDSYDWRTGVKTPAYLDGEWHHCAVTYDGTVTKIYFDGELKSSTSAFKYLTSPESMRMVIGFEIDLDEWDWNGALDDVGVWTKVLTAEEIATLASDK